MIFRYVHFDRVESYLAMGWHFCGIASAHSALMHSCCCHEKKPKIKFDEWQLKEATNGKAPQSQERNG